MFQGTVAVEFHDLGCAWYLWILFSDGVFTSIYCTMATNHSQNDDAK